MKFRKTVGPDGLSVEVWKVIGLNGVKMVSKAFQLNN